MIRGRAYMMLLGSGTWSCPVRWPYSWTMIVQKRDHVNVTRELNAMWQSIMRSPGVTTSHIDAE